MITREQFIAATGREPQNDDLERCNCAYAGTMGHLCCGWNEQRNLPQFECGPLPLHRTN
jgi:hypothetical protein